MDERDRAAQIEMRRGGAVRSRVGRGSGASTPIKVWWICARGACAR